VVIWHLGYFVGKCKVLERETTRSVNYVSTERGCSCPFCYEPCSHVSSSSSSSACAPIQIACPAMTTRCLSNEVPAITRYCEGVERQHCHPESWRRSGKRCRDRGGGRSSGQAGLERETIGLGPATGYKHYRVLAPTHTRLHSRSSTVHTALRV
jgi:hypothetical protein